MKRCSLWIPVVLFLLLAAHAAFSGTLPRGVTIAPDGSGYVVSLALPPLETAGVRADGEEYALLSIPGYGTTAVPGRPMLPLISFNLCLSPQEGRPSVTTLSREQADNVLPQKVYPAQEPWPKSRPLADRPFAIDRSYYLGHGISSAPLATVSEQFVIGGVHGVTVTIFPYAYDPVENRLTSSRRASFRIHLSRPPAAATVHSSLFDDYLKTLFVNYRSEGTLERSNYLIITAPEFEAALAPFITHKQGLGYDVFVATTAVAGSTNTAIKSYIQQRYDNPATRPEFILLVGDVDRVPEWIGGTTDNPHTDINYTLLDGPDYFADAHLGRFAISSATELSNAITKSIFMENAIFGLEKKNVFLSSNDNWNITEATHNAVIDSFFTPNGYLSSKRYSHTYSATTAQVIADLNGGQIFAIYSGHGSVTSWADGPPVSQSDVRGLTNSIYPHVYSFSCLTGAFDETECFGETWIRQQRGGASYWGSSVTSYWDEDDVLERRLFHAMFTDRLTQSTPMFNMAKVFLAAHYGGITATVKRYFEMYNLLGDPSVQVASFTANFGWVQGTVTSGGAPLAGVTLDFVEGIPQQGGFTAGDGAYLAGARVDTAAPTALVTLRARKFGYITATDTLTLVREDTVGRDISLAPAAGGTLRVHAFRSDSTGLGAAIAVVFEGSTVISDSTASSTGLFTAPLPAGSYTVRVDAPAPYATRTFSPVVIDSGQTMVVEALVRFVIEPLPVAISDTLVVGQVHGKTLVLTNTTPDSVPYRLSDDSALRTLRRTRGPVTQPRVVPIVPVERSKDAADAFAHPPVTKGRGGPDTFGYRWIDSDESDGPSFVWRDISTLGTAITGIGDDDNEGPFQLGFTFPFYGNSYDAVRFCTNGWISFTSTVTSYSNTGLPSSAEPNNAIYAFWDDITFSSSGNAYYYFDAAAQEFVVQYTDVPHIGSTGPYTFQIILRPGGEILYQYLSMGNPVNSATIGIENADGTIALEIAENAAYLHDSLAVRFFLPDAPWVSENPSYGILPPLAGTNIDITFDAFGLQVGTTYDATIALDVVHADVAGPMVIPVTMRVQPADSAVLLLGATSVTFPLTPLFASRTDSFSARNGGALPLTISSITSTNTDFLVMPGSAVLPSGDSLTVRVTYTPTVAGGDTGHLVFLSNSQGSPSMTVGLAGTSAGIPDITVSPSSFTFNLPSNNDTTHAVFTVHNPGTDTLRFRLEEDIPVRSASMIRSEEQQHAIEQPKGGTDAGGASEQVLGSGGPDSFGYRWIDSDEPGGPIFDWVDITGVGTPVTTWTGSDDDGHAIVPFPFPFPLYGGLYNQLKIVTNGWIGLDAASADNSYNNTAIPTAAEPNLALYPWWDDLDLGDGGSVHYYPDAANGRFIVQFTNVPHYGTTTPGMYTFQVLLYAGGNIIYQYRGMQQTLNSATIGIENANGTVALQVAFNAAYMHDNLAILFTRDLVPWMSCGTEHGVVAPGDSMDVQLCIHPAGLGIGPQDAAIRVMGNTPAMGVLMVHLDIISGVMANAPLPVEFSLSQNYPNPFNPSCMIRYGLPQGSPVTLALYNLLGQRIAVLDEGMKPAGYHEVSFSASGLASGVYLYRLEAGSFSSVRKMIILR
jgi:hypothetical protein